MRLTTNLLVVLITVLISLALLGVVFKSPQLSEKVQPSISINETIGYNDTVLVNDRTNLVLKKPQYTDICKLYIKSIDPDGKVDKYTYNLSNNSLKNISSINFPKTGEWLFKGNYTECETSYNSSLESLGVTVYHESDLEVKKLREEIEKIRKEMSKGQTEALGRDIIVAVVSVTLGLVLNMLINNQSLNNRKQNIYIALIVICVLTVAIYLYI